MIAIGSDHGGFALKQALMAHLEKRGTGIGMSITANKIPGIRAALCGDCFSAEATRLHNDANILCMGARVVGEGLALKIADTFLDTPFSGDARHIRRISQIEG